MELLALVGEISKYGATPALLVLIGLVGMLLRKVDVNARADSERHKAEEKAREVLRNDLVGVIKETEIRIERRNAADGERLDDLTRRINLVERDYLTRDEHYKEFSGWRTEITRLQDLILKLWQDKKDKQ